MERYAKWMSGFGLVAAGMVIGAALFMSIYQNSMSILLQRNGELELRVGELEDALKHYQQMRTRQQTIGKIDILMEPADGEGPLSDAAVVNELKKRVYQDMSKYAGGKPVTVMKDNPDLYVALLEQKVYRNIYEKDYVVRVKRMYVIQNELILYLMPSLYTER